MSGQGSGLTKSGSGNKSHELLVEETETQTDQTIPQGKVSVVALLILWRHCWDVPTDVGQLVGVAEGEPEEKDSTVIVSSVCVSEKRRQQVMPKLTGWDEAPRADTKGLIAKAGVRKTVQA